jgi:hypothetical protein
MSGPAQPYVPAEPRPPGSDYLPQSPPGDPPPSASNTWRILAWTTAGVAGAAAIVWFIFFGPGETGSKGQWFFGAAVLVAVLVSLWQTHSILRQARRDAADADNRLRGALAAAEERSARELALVRSMHEAELDSQRQLARAELAAQVELARVERVHMIAQQQKLALTGVSRAVGAQTQALGALWNQGAAILSMDDRDAREQAMKPVFEQIGQVVNDFAVELANANLLVEDERLQHALLRVNEAVLMAMHVAEDVHNAVVDGRTPNSEQVSSAQRLMREKAAEARHLAWNLLRNGVDDTTPTA